MVVVPNIISRPRTDGNRQLSSFIVFLKASIVHRRDLVWISRLLRAFKFQKMWSLSTAGSRCEHNYNIFHNKRKSKTRTIYAYSK
jgi:hypothetical protein